MTTPNPRLVNDLAQLVGKYKASDWEALAAWLEGERLDQLRLLLKEMAAVSREVKTKRKPKTRTPMNAPSRVPLLRERIKHIRQADPVSADLLDEIWLKLRERELLPTIADVRAFAAVVGMKRLQATRRDQAITELMEHLAGLQPQSLLEEMRATLASERSFGDEYEQWVRLILNEGLST